MSTSADSSNASKHDAHLQRRHGEDPFYVGYQHQLLPELAQFLTRRVALILGLVLVAGATIAFTQNQFGPAVFEFGEVREFQGYIQEEPYPVLKVQRPGQTAGRHWLSSYYLVDPLKFGADRYVKGLDGQAVKLRGELLYRENQTMLVIDPESIEKLAALPETAAPAQAELNTGVQADDVPTGTVELTGEIMDSKCYLGAMNPGERKVHRACAIRCISGGIPPVFVVRTSTGRVQHLLLVSPEGKAVNAEVLEYVALPLRIRGEVRFTGGQYMLFADPASFERL